MPDLCVPSSLRSGHWLCCGREWLKSRPESGCDWRMCSKFPLHMLAARPWQTSSVLPWRNSLEISTTLPDVCCLTIDPCDDPARFRDDTRSKYLPKKLATPEGYCELGSNCPDFKASELYIVYRQDFWNSLVRKLLGDFDHLARLVLLDHRPVRRSCPGPPIYLIFNMRQSRPDSGI